MTSELLPTESSRFGDRSEILVTNTMHRRKQEMFERSDGFVVLPCGFAYWKRVDLRAAGNEYAGVAWAGGYDDRPRTQASRGEGRYEDFDVPPHAAP